MNITRDSKRNRVYIADIDSAVAYALRLRPDGERWWIGVADYMGEEKIKETAAYLAAEQQAQAEYAGLKTHTIPTDYRARHGALLGGSVSFGDFSDEIRPVAEGLLRLPPWEQMGQLTIRAHGGLINGRIRDQKILFRTPLTDGRLVFREQSARDFGDDLRETYWLPEDVFLALCISEIRRRKITSEQAKEWLASYRGCVDTELFEVATTLEPASLMIAATEKKL